MLPLLAPVAIGAGLFGLGAVLGGTQKPRMAGEGPSPKGEMPPGTTYIDANGEIKVWEDLITAHKALQRGKR